MVHSISSVIFIIFWENIEILTLLPPQIIWRLPDILYWYFVTVPLGSEQIWVEAVNIRQLNCKFTVKTSQRGQLYDFGENCPFTVFKILAEKHQELFLFFCGMLAYSICILLVFVCFMFHFYKIISYLIIVRNARIVLNTF